MIFLSKRAGIIFLVALLAVVVSFSMGEALDVQRKVLPSGLIVLHVKRHNLPLVMVTLLVKAGSIDESEDKAGLASLTASLLTEGTESRSSIQVGEETEFIGANLVASASEDFSTVSLSVLKKDVNKGFELFSDVLVHPTFPPEEVRRVKKLVAGSLKQQEEQPSFLAARALKREVFGSHPYGRIVQGSIETVKNIDRKDIVDYYSTYYVPNNAILSVVGDLSTDELEELVTAYLDGWNKKPLPTRSYPEIKPTKRKVVLIDKDLTQANILIGHVGTRRDNPDHYALSVMNYILGGGGFSSRLMETIRDEMGLAYSVYSYFSSDLYSGMFQAGAQTKNESANTVIDEIIRQMKRMQREEVSDSEIADAKAYLVGSFPRRLDTMGKIANFLSQVEFYGLGLDYPERYPDLIGSVTKADVLRVAKKYLHPVNHVLVVVADQAKAKVVESP